MGSQLLDYSPRGTEDDVVLEPPIRLPSRLFSPGTGLKQTWLETRRFGPGDASISPPLHHVSAVHPAPCFSLPIRYEWWPVFQSSRVVFRRRIRRRGQPCTNYSSYFGENQLSPSSFGISPLPTPHPRTFQRTWVQQTEYRAIRRITVTLTKVFEHQRHS